MTNMVQQANKLHETIKVTLEISKTEISFLDITAYKGERFQSTGILDVRTHTKPTSKQLYVHVSSYHPKGVGKGLIIGEALRYLRTNSNVSIFQQQMSKHESTLTKRGYSANLSCHLLKSIRHEDRAKSLVYRQKGTRIPLPFVTTFSDMAPSIRRIVFGKWEKLHSNDLLKKIFPDLPIMAFCKNPSIGNRMFRAKKVPIFDEDFSLDGEGKVIVHNTLPNPHLGLNSAVVYDG